MRKLWSKALQSDIVSWCSFWKALLWWCQPHVDTLASDVLRSDCQLRKLCQKKICPKNSEHVHVGHIDEAFPPHVPLLQQIDVLLSAAQELQPETSGGTLEPTTAQFYDELPPFLHSNQRFCGPWLDDSMYMIAATKLQAYSSELNQREIHLRALCSDRGQELTSAQFHETTDGRLSLEPVKGQSRLREVLDVLVIGSQTACSLSRALVKVIQVISHVRSHLTHILNVEGQRNKHRQVICVNGPAMSGKTHFASYLGHSICQGSANPHNSTLPLMRRVELSGIFHLEQAIEKLSKAFGCISLKRDLELPFRRLCEAKEKFNLFLILDQVDALPSSHLADFVRLVLHVAPSTNVLVTSRLTKLQLSRLVCQQLLQPWSKVPLQL